MRSFDNRSMSSSNDHLTGHTEISTPKGMQLKPIARILKASAFGIGFGLIHSTGHAATITATSSSDSGSSCTLREAIVSVNNGAVEPGCVVTGTDPFGTDDTIVFGGELASGGIIPLNGSELYLAPTKTLTIDASLTSGVTIDGLSDTRVMEVGESADLTINNLTITRGEASSGAGISVMQYASLTAEDCTIVNNSAGFMGGGIRADGRSEILLINTSVSGNTANFFGGGINAYEESQISILDSTISDNIATNASGGGIRFFGERELEGDEDSSSSLYIENSQVTGNSSGGEGGGISTKYNVAVGLEDSMVSGNVSGNAGKYGAGGGLAIQKNSSSLVLYNSTVSGNTASGSDNFGGGVFASGQQPDSSGAITGGPILAIAYDSTISGNSAQSGGGIMLDYGTSYVGYGLEFASANNKISENVSTSSGGGIHIKNGSLLPAFGSTISGNSAAQHGGGVYVDGTSLFIAFPGFTNYSIVPSEISDNSAALNGGGIFFAEGSGSNSIGSSIGPFNSTNNVKYSTVSGNKSGQQGGGVYLGGRSIEGGEGILIASASTFSNNSAGLTSGAVGASEGGGLALAPESFLLLMNSTVSGNAAKGFGGGGIYANGAYAQINNSTIFNNNAGQVGNPKDGGGILASSGGSLSLENSIVGGSMANNDCEYDSSSVSIDSNSIVQDGSCDADRSGDPGLYPLANNGGPARTKTHLPRATSIAIDTGDNATCTDRDQRVVERPTDIEDEAVCDVGSVEFRPEDITGFIVIPLPDGKVVVVPE